MKWRSLRVSFLVGSILWTMGLLGVAHLSFVTSRSSSRTSSSSGTGRSWGASR